MKKEVCDGLFFSILLLILVLFQFLTNPEFNLFENLSALLPFLLINSIGYKTKLPNWSLFLILFLTWFIWMSFSDPASMVDWTSYLLTGIFSLFFSGLFTLIIAHGRKNKVEEDRIFKWVRKKLPNASNLILFLSETVLLMISLISITFLFTQEFNWLIITFWLIFSIYTSGSDLYFHKIKKAKKER
ncbi:MULTISPECIES: hypothetical protein [Vagococcus]|uniref:Uncharacterized protein n=1 Tax=Vagococcus fluvialis bH819 TaxID=1255619 RepID=A0A1X6WP30_9ENTE|nr:MULTISPECIES: hypothetical protein [Vagococcus]SLM86064.1 hypothetical protein FM121_08250 [Vagococcus fluvialis bH819]HCM90314.1 hypothetical protein [Vagococcus sp.]